MRPLLLLQIMLIVFSRALVRVKVAAEAWSRAGFWSPGVLGALASSVAILALYAVGWQKILQRLPLTVAYFNRGLVVFWGLVWSAFLFDETLTFFNLLGTAVIFAGLALVNRP
jgi:drug/metabolite transporter (DMT)-like permease